MLLCDFAEELGGKLYIMGGGWSRITLNEPAVSLSLAIKVDVPWDRTNEQIPMVIWLETQDGPIWADPDGDELKMEGKLEVGRPVGIEKGTPLDSALVVRLKDVPLTPGRYVWVLQIDGEDAVRTPFTVLEGGRGQ